LRCKEALAAAYNRQKKTHTSWHNEFKEKYKIELEQVINEELKPTNNKGISG
jgi:acetolactate synthase-1/2/3 large subunit